MKVKITKQIVWTVETAPVQKRKCPTGGKPQQNIILNAIRIITQHK